MPLIKADDLLQNVTRPARRGVPQPPHQATIRPAVPGEVPLEEILNGRRSVRDFADEPLTPELVTRVLTLATATYRRTWPDGPPLSLLLAASKVTGWARGLRGDENEPLPTDPRLLPCLASRYTDAPLLVLIRAPISDADGYANLLVQAGALGYAVWLAARAHGLDCSVYGRASSDLGDAQLRHLFTVAVGLASSTTP